MDIMNINKMNNAVKLLHAKAAAVKPVTVKNGDDVYNILWNGYHGQFEVTKNGQYFCMFNTRMISQARVWLKEAI